MKTESFDLNATLNSTVVPIIQEMKQIVSDFFAERGGMGNGYVTWISGRVERGVLGVIDWSTPTMKEFTGIEASNKGRELYNNLYSILEKYNVPRDFVIEFKTEHRSWGCYNTYITYTYKEQVL